MAKNITKIIKKDGNEEIAKIFEHSAYEKLKIGEILEIECSKTNLITDYYVDSTLWEFGFFTNIFTIVIKPVNDSTLNKIGHNLNEI